MLVSIMKERKGSHLVAQSPYMLSSTCVLWLMPATVQIAQDFFMAGTTGWQKRTSSMDTSCGQQLVMV